MSETIKTVTLPEDTIAELRELLREAEDVLADSGPAGGAKVEALRERLRVALAEGRNAVDHLRELARRRAGELDAQVRSHPYESMGIAVGIGALLGLACSRLLR